MSIDREILKEELRKAQLGNENFIRQFEKLTDTFVCDFCEYVHKDKCDHRNDTTTGIKLKGVAKEDKFIIITFEVKKNGESRSEQPD